MKHNLTSLIIQGLKEIGEGNIDTDQIKQIQAIIEKSNESKRVKENIKYAPVWIQKIVLNILKTIGYE